MERLCTHAISAISNTGRDRTVSIIWILALLIALVVLVAFTRPAISSAIPSRVPAAERRAPPSDTPLVSTLSHLRLVNYYPAFNAWTYMWTRWNAPEIARDLARIRALDANAVRIIIQPAAFGYPHPAPHMLHELARTIALAHRRGLRVQLTLFDWWHDYAGITRSERWMHAVLAPYAGDHRIAFIELQNEIDPSNAAATAWARRLIPDIRHIAGFPVTLSVTGRVSTLATLKSALGSSQPDFFTYHYYGNAGLALSTFRRAAAIASPYPLFIGETGYSTITPKAGGTGCSRAAQNAFQDLYLRSIEYAARAAGLPLAAPWTLSDFARTALPAAMPRSLRERGFGLTTLSGRLKPAGKSLRAILSGAAPSLAFNNSFESHAGRLPLDWRVNDPEGATFAVDTTVAHAGTASARISKSTGSSAISPAFFTTPVESAVTPGQRRILSAWFKGRHATGNTRIAIAWFGAEGSYLGQTESPSLPRGTTNWMRLTVNGIAPPGAVYAQIHLKSSHNTGTVWFDDVSFN